MSRRGDDPAALAETLRLLHGMGFHRWAGMTAPERAADGSVSVTIKAEGEAVMPFGGLHGGVLTGLYEFPALAALLPELAPDEWAVTADVHARNIGAVRTGDTVTITGRLVKRGRGIAFVEAEARVSDRLVGRASITKAIVPSPDVLKPG
ncbi:hypothetical protein C882_1471 [Caenispirillum salinarum AK4]|uniref:Thioesterase domain-containing protein n=1 Tax=Caenispirillum salinarum AK4 TaxID=1238182 RepID=K9GNX1_9PROT|nr:PaaI family thioesterase [Caenispirillum salinarum]EKV27625.1 hypothetical protein C882_1471 [Caenispirillum salinarum AK4]